MAFIFGLKLKSNTIVMLPSVYLASDYRFALSSKIEYVVPIVNFSCYIVCNCSFDFH